MAFKITTTGTIGIVEFPDIGSRTYTHPVVGLDLLTEGYTIEELRESSDIAAAVDVGEITVEDAQGNPITASGELAEVAAAHELAAHTDIAFTGLANSDVMAWNSTSEQWENMPPSGLPVDDTTSLVQDPVDNTKQVRLDAGALTASSTRVITIPDQDVDLTPNIGTFPAAAHAARHERAGADEIDGDHLDIDFTPSNYTPDITPAEAGNVDDLAAHLAGIDGALGASFGGGYQYQERMTSAGTSSFTPLEYMSMTTASLPAGTYYIGWSVIGRNTATFGDWEIHVQVDNTTDIVNPGDIGKTREEGIDGGSDQKYARSGFRVVALGAGAHTIDIDISNKGAGTASLFFGNIVIWRVA